MNFNSLRAILSIGHLLGFLFVQIPALAQESWVYECRHLCSEDCRGKMFIEGVDVKCSCEDCQPMISCFEDERLIAIYAGRRAMEEAHRIGQYFYHYTDELNNYILKYWPNEGYQISRVEYHKLPDRRYVKYYLISISGNRTAVAFMADANEYHYILRCESSCDTGPLLEGVSKRAQEFCVGKSCRIKKEIIRLHQF